MAHAAAGSFEACLEHEACTYDDTRICIFVFAGVHVAGPLHGPILH